jgi:sulfite exporter TauE/SafE
MRHSDQNKTNDEWADYPDKRHILLNTLKANAYDKVGKIIGVVGISRDITNRKNTLMQFQN